MSDLKAWREGRHISQTEFAAKVGTTQPHLSAIENGDDGVSLELSISIFKETGICVGKLKNATPKQAKTIAEVVSAA